MKIQIASDLHLEFLKNHKDHLIIEPSEADVLVLAGDIHSQDLARQAFGTWTADGKLLPVVYVAGNHEFYHHEYHDVRAKLKAGIGPIMHYLENDEVLIQGVRFLGCTLWTDYALNNDVPNAMRHAKDGLNDHEVIQFSDRLFTPQDALALHQESRAWLESKLDEPFEGKTVVVTHHCPHRLSLDPAYRKDPCNAAFVSDLSHLMGKAALWIHGHTHSSFDYTVHGTRVICNPCGYPSNSFVRDLSRLRFENPDFNKRLVVEI